MKRRRSIQRRRLPNHSLDSIWQKCAKRRGGPEACQFPNDTLRPSSKFRNVHRTHTTATFSERRGFAFGNLCAQHCAPVFHIIAGVAFGERRKNEDGAQRFPHPRRIRGLYTTRPVGRAPSATSARLAGAWGTRDVHAVEESKGGAGGCNKEMQRLKARY